MHPRTTLLVLTLLLAAACRDRSSSTSTARTFRSPTEPVVIGMDVLHQTGGVPPGWRFAIPPGDAAEGRKAFVALGCSSCHAVKGESFAPSGDGQHVGPELTGMGSHHPAAYFAESILNPDAVLVDGPDFADDQGHSRMPSYPDLTLVQLVDLVAYLQSLTDASGAFAGGEIGFGLTPRPPAPQSDATAYFVQAYDVRPGRLEDLERWFAGDFLPALRAADGFVSADTHVDNMRPGGSLVTILAFRDDAALSRFLASPQGAAVKKQFDDFVGPHGHQRFRSPPYYPAGTLSGR